MTTLAFGISWFTIIVSLGIMAIVSGSVTAFAFFLAHRAKRRPQGFEVLLRQEPKN